jgi:hypothetical protein|tara:strand:- start:594 stop:824 length:231 start_codon:yes stop_codon:yes gene_type:complete
MRNGGLIKVEGHSSLSKDMNSGAILNTNSSEIDAARSRRLNAINKKENDKKLKSEIEFLKNEMSEIKFILKQIIEK